MAIPGLNLLATVWRMNNAADDDVGGAMITGTPIYTSLPFSIMPQKPSQISLEAGLEVPALYDATCRANGISLLERDEVQVTAPTGHPLYNLRLRIIGVQSSRRRGRHTAQHLTLSRIRRSRRRQ